jgi:hypothetical protein
MSWNLELGQVDILESVLAVMDKLKEDKPVLESHSEQDENSEDSFPQSVKENSINNQLNSPFS